MRADRKLVKETMFKMKSQEEDVLKRKMIKSRYMEDDVISRVSPVYCIFTVVEFQNFVKDCRASGDSDPYQVVLNVIRDSGIQ